MHFQDTVHVLDLYKETSTFHTLPPWNHPIDHQPQSVLTVQEQHLQTKHSGGLLAQEQHHSAPSAVEHAELQ
jgi:hypothetical protein